VQHKWGLWCTFFSYLFSHWVFGGVLPRGSVMNQHLLWPINGGCWRDREVGDVEQSKYYIYSPPNAHL
jgi:hypothetical protein